jgi:hypothetical protein
MNVISGVIESFVELSKVARMQIVHAGMQIEICSGED